MIIIFGTRTYFASNKVRQHAFCDHCGNFAAQKSFTAMTFFHLYYIPLIPTQGKRRHHKSCSSCRQELVFEPETHEALSLRVKERSADAIVALHEGQTKFREVAGGEFGENLDVDGGGDAGDELTPCGPFLRGAVDWFFASGEADFCRSVVEQLSHPEHQSIRHMVAGDLAMYESRYDDALSAYHAATGARDADGQPDPAPYMAAGNLLMHTGKLEPAITVYEKLLKDIDDVTWTASVRNTLAGLYFQTRRYREAVETMDALMKQHPELTADRAFMKKYNKAVKKAA